MKKRILIVFGTRPEAIKMAPLIKEFQNNTEKFSIKVCVTAQHREMLDQVLDIFNIVPDYDLNIMKSNQDLYDITSKVLLQMKDIIHETQPDLLLVHGDTTTSMASALAAYYQQVPVGHVEAGLRTYDKYSPFPEEINRQITGKIADYHFAPTENAKENLLNESILGNKIFITGNTVIDALYWALSTIEGNLTVESSIKASLQELFSENIDEILSSKIILVTGHRRENFGEGFRNICEALKEIALMNPGINIIYPLHLNPMVQEPVRQILTGIKNIHLIKPLPYLEFLFLLRNSHLILTDSGGIQEEAPSLRKPVLVMRDNSERPEAINAGCVRLVGTSKQTIVNETIKILNDRHLYEEMTSKNNPYGDGTASIKIISAIQKIFFNEKP